VASALIHSGAKAMAARSDNPEAIMPGAWVLVWTIYIVKLVMIFAIFWAAHSFQPTVLVAMTTWIWVGPALAIAAGPAAFKIRLRRIRRKRAALIAAEWLEVTEEAVADDVA
jgi:hypothetical protein